tara:strand:- start:18 stop:209 length:192 start_codon:yes stop_codon:yes gene_type:complete
MNPSGLVRERTFDFETRGTFYGKVKVYYYSSLWPDAYGPGLICATAGEKLFTEGRTYLEWWSC